MLLNIRLLIIMKWLALPQPWSSILIPLNFWQILSRIIQDLFIQKLQLLLGTIVFICERSISVVLISETILCQFWHWILPTNVPRKIECFIYTYHNFIQLILWNTGICGWYNRIISWEQLFRSILKCFGRSL